MTPNQRELWEKVSHYSFDDPKAAYPFTERLAKENGWNLGYALRVVEEYRRFAFLAVTAGHPVSPSDAVDQAWHLHQLYSDSYWDDFNAEVLGKTLSHQPTKGGEEETEKFARWYDRTLESYVRLFGQQPPIDIWPLPKTVEVSKPHYTRVNHAENWVVEKSSVKAVAFLICLWICTFGGLMAIGALVTGDSLLNLKSRDFLGFYISTAFVLFVFVLALVSKLRGVEAPVHTPDPSILDPYVLACLNGGPKLAVFAAIAKLFNEGKLRRDSGSDTLSADRAYVVNGHPLEMRLHEHALTMGRGCSPAALCKAAELQTAMLVNELEDRHLWLTDGQYQRMRGIVAGILSALVTMGFIKILVGASRGKPVFFLVLLTLITGLLSFYYVLKLSRRTSLGNEVLSVTKSRSEEAVGKGLIHDPAMVTLIIAGMGIAALPSLGMADLRKTLAPPNQGGEGGSSCGTSGCGGGSSGCGGGGCGGCGGS